MLFLLDKSCWNKETTPTNPFRTAPLVHTNLLLAACSPKMPDWTPAFTSGLNFIHHNHFPFPFDLFHQLSNFTPPQSSPPLQPNFCGLYQSRHHCLWRNLGPSSHCLSGLVWLYRLIGRVLCCLWMYVCIFRWYNNLNGFAGKILKTM